VVGSSDFAWLPLAAVKPWRRNPRKNKKAVAPVAASMRRWGFVAPVVIWPGGDRMVAGHTRIQALELLLREEGAGYAPKGAPGPGLVPVRFQEFASEAEADAYALADNKLGEIATWDEEALPDILRGMQAEDEALLKLAGFGDGELARLLKDSEEPDDQVDVGQAEVLRAKWQTEEGQLWTILSRSAPGRSHRVLCGDSASAADVARLLCERPALIFTDPPYNCADEMSESFYEGCNSDAMKELAQAEWDQGFDPQRFLSVLSAHRPDPGTVYICTSHWLAPDIWAWMRAEGASHHSYVVWAKSNPMPSLAKRHWTWATELICYATFGRHTFNFPDEGHALSWWALPYDVKERMHPTQKPLSVPQRAIVHSSQPGDVVADLFLGSGTTLIVAERERRLCYGMELSPAYLAVILERASKLGLEPRLL